MTRTEPANQQTSKPEAEPDNRAAWNAIAAAYQARYRLPTDSFKWGIWCPDESQLELLGDIRGKRVLVLGCGGGQDCLALAKMGAAEVTGIDLSDEQLAHARRLLDEHGVSARLIQGSVEELSAIEDASQDIAVSIFALNYVERADRCLAETYRMLVPGGLFAFSEQHPADASTGDEPPYGFQKSYFRSQWDWQWESLGRGDVTLRSWFRTVADWFALLTDAGFIVQRLLEPRPVDDPAWRRSGWGSQAEYQKYETVPGTVIFVARRPEVLP